MPDITTPVQVVAGNPVKASDHNTSSDAIVELTAALETLQNSQLVDGSFENDLASWVASDIGGGSHSIEETTVIHGVKSFKAIATALGGYVDLDSDDFLLVGAGIDDVFIDGRIQVSGQVQVQGWIEWFDVDDISISTQQFMDYTFGAGELNAWLRFRGWGRAVATARSYKLSFQLGDGTVAGNIYLDGIKTRLNDPFQWIVLDTQTVMNGGLDLTSDAYNTVRIPVIGSAYSAWTQFEIGADPLDVDEEYQYNADTGNWVLTGADSGAATERSISYSDTVPSPAIDGIKCNEDGAIYVHVASAGSGLIYYTQWR